MIGVQPTYTHVPLEYRNALDAAMALLGGHAHVAVCCGVPALGAELTSRLPRAAKTLASAALWVEPPLDEWREELAGLARDLTPGATLCVVTSLPLARLIPERRGWPGRALGMRPGGIARLRRGLAGAGFAAEAHHGFHGIASIALNALSARAARAARPDMADRLHFAGRLRYISSGPLAAFSTVALLVAKRR